MTVPKRNRNRGRGRLTLAQRRWVYGVLAAASGVALAAGWITDSVASSLVVLAAALAGTTTIALAHPTED